MPTKSWLVPDAHAGSYALGMLGLEERKLLYQLACDWYSGAGAIVDLGTFCGASSCCLAAGLRDNPRARGQRVHTYDCFIASEPYLVDFIRTQFGEPIELGQSFVAIFRRATAEFADYIQVHEGNLLEQSWQPKVPIEILFVDVAKTLALSGKVLTEFFSHLIPGKSIVIQQDFYHPTAFYLPVIMDFLRGHFTIIEPCRDWSVAFRLEKPISPETLRAASMYQFSFARQQAALFRMMRRVGQPGREYLRISRCAAVGTYFGEHHFRSALAAAMRRSRIQNDAVWSNGLAWCKDFNATRIRTRLYGNPSLMPPPGPLDRVSLIISAMWDKVVALLEQSTRSSRR
jgi:methyltransferase family protein